MDGRFEAAGNEALKDELEALIRAYAKGAWGKSREPALLPRRCFLTPYPIDYKKLPNATSRAYRQKCRQISPLRIESAAGFGFCRLWLAERLITRHQSDRGTLHRLLAKRQELVI